MRNAFYKMHVRFKDIQTLADISVQLILGSLFLSLEIDADLPDVGDILINT